MQQDFPYVEIQEGSLTSKWKRILRDEVPQHEAKADGVDFRVSVVRYKEPKPTDGEPCISPLFFDVDVKGNPGKALEDTRKVLTYLREELMIEEPYPQIWFSGQKGFHILVHEDVLGIIPHSHLQEILKTAVDQISGVLEIKSIDKQIYSKRRIMRFENTQHPETKLFKIELSYEETMSLPIDQIQQMARKKRTLVRQVPLDQFIPSDYAVHWWDSIVQDWNNRQQQEQLKPKVKIKRIEGDQEPVCIQHFQQSGAPEGLRNKVAYTMASYYSNQGLPKQQTEDILVEWTKRHYAHESHKLQERLSNARNVARAVYDGDYYFSCSVCRNIDPSGYYCPGYDKCHHVESEESQAPEKIPIVELAEATHHLWLNKTIKIPVHVVGVADDVFEIPKTVRAYCSDHPDECDGECTNCSLYPEPEITKVINMKTRALLQFFNVRDDEKMLAMKRMLKVSRKCNNARVITLQTSNISQLVLNPMVKSLAQKGEFYPDKEVRGTFVQETGYFIGHIRESNEKYMLTCTLISDPNTQKEVFLIDSMEPERTGIDNFNPTKAELEQLEVFRPKTNQSVAQKFDEIHEDFEVNVHKIVKRKIVGYAVDLAYHSCLSYKFDGTVVPKGWMECVIVGDSAQGKSALVRSMFTHYQMGTWTSAENEKRTGLGYSLQQSNGKKGQWFVKWGALPQNDRGLLVVDEFSGMEKALFAEMTAARYDGVISAKGTGNGKESYCRTRGIYISNPRPRYKGSDGSMSNFMYGVEAFNELYAEHQDIRRVDFAVCLRSEEVNALDLNTPITRKVPHVYTSALCKMLVTWAWTRKREHIVFDEGAVDEVRAAAIRMCGVYAISSKSWLVENATQKEKIARAAIAVAARLFSTDVTMQRVIVTKEHVKFAEQVFYMSYNSHGMQYNLFSAHNKSAPYIEETTKRHLQKIMDNNLRNRCTMKNLLKNICNSSIISQDRLVKWGIERAHADSIMDELRENGLIDSEDMKTNSGIELFKFLNDKATRPIT